MRHILATIALLLLVSSANAAPRRAATTGPVCWVDTKNLPECASYNAYVSERLNANAPAGHSVGPGDVLVGFQVDHRGSKRILSLQGTSPAHKKLAVKSVMSTALRPPPGPWARFSQEFRFR